MTTSSSHEKRIRASTRPRGDQGELVFALSLDQETVTLDPGTTWAHADHFKWVVRGLIEEPHMLHVFPDGSVEINSEKINITDADATPRLEDQINKRHSLETALHSTASSASPNRATPASAPDPRRFRVKLDHFGHLMIEWGHSIEREETGLRGIGSLIANGLIRKPEHYRVDPMQRGIEIDGVNYACNEAGAKQLEAALNTRYAPQTKGQSALAIEIKENHAASTGFDIHFRFAHAGVAHDVKGHLTQELLDQLQDSAKCELIQPGIHLLLSPPNLLIRKRRPDLGEEKIPQLPDVNLHRVTATQLQQIFNHPLVLRNAGPVDAASLPPVADNVTISPAPVEPPSPPPPRNPLPRQPTPPVSPDVKAPPKPGEAIPGSAPLLPGLDPVLAALFHETDSLRINQAVFQRLSEHLGLPAQTVLLTLPFVFENRKFEIINFERQEITSLMELRGTDFYGFYLSHINERKIVLVYACNGMHIEWGPDKCVLQPTVKSEAEEYRGNVLLGLAQNRKNEFVFVVHPEFKKWITPREMPYTDENLQFLTVADLAAAPDDYTLIWPQRPVAGS